MTFEHPNKTIPLLLVVPSKRTATCPSSSTTNGDGGFWFWNLVYRIAAKLAGCMNLNVTLSCFYRILFHAERIDVDYLDKINSSIRLSNSPSWYSASFLLRLIGLNYQPRR
jgi:hypothetical protein